MTNREEKLKAALEKIELFKKLWYTRNPVHEINLDSGEDMFWETAAIVAEEYTEALQEWEKEKDEPGASNSDLDSVASHLTNK